MTLSLAYAFTLAWRFNKELVFFFSPNISTTLRWSSSVVTVIKHINRHFIGTQMVKTEKISRTRDLQMAHDRKSALCCCLFCARSGTNECIIHMRQDSFLPVEEVGLTPHVPGLKGAPLPEIRHDSLHLGVLPVYGVSCVPTPRPLACTEQAATQS